MQAYVVSGKSHGTVVMSRHRSVEVARRNRDKIAAKHAAFCQCSGPRVMYSTNGLPIGYQWPQEEAIEAPAIDAHSRQEAHRLLDEWITAKAATLRVYPASGQLVRTENDSMVALHTAVGQCAVEESL